ncbi:hypothetical protein AYI70_g1479 [Smittium culicis]|uniref:RING-type domain-containing protein n=1 Tax=Smittium culicis TaxID=133412 RepID=A0A1R1YCH1_9FUNG|nr:hypothetical protein AYI70_g1479 [Smittium culicis]
MDTLWSAQRQNIPPFQADNDVCPICHSDRYLNQSMKLFVRDVHRSAVQYGPCTMSGVHANPAQDQLLPANLRGFDGGEGNQDPQPHQPHIQQTINRFRQLKGVQRLPRECGGHYVQAAEQRERARGRGRDTQIHASEQVADRSQHRKAGY